MFVATNAADISRSILSVYVWGHRERVPVVMEDGVLAPRHVMLSDGRCSRIPMSEDPDMAFDACLSAVAPSPATHSRWMELKAVETVRQTGFALC